MFFLQGSKKNNKRFFFVYMKSRSPLIIWKQKTETLGQIFKNLAQKVYCVQPQNYFSSCNILI